MIMLHLWSFRWLWLQFILRQYVTADWPSSNSSNIQLLGLFPDISNTSKPTTWSIHSRAMFKAAIVLSHQYNITIGEQFIGWQSVQTGDNVISALRSSCIAMSVSNIVGIVGPGFSRESNSIALFAKKIGIPVISYSAMDLESFDSTVYSAFYRIVPSDNVRALAIAKLFIKFNWTSCIIIYQNDAFGSGGVEAISRTFNDNDLIVTDTIIFDITTLTIRGDLKRFLKSSSTRIVLVWAKPTYTTLILQNALDSDVVGPQFTWILTSNVPLNSFNQTSYEKLIGILTVEPVAGNVVNAAINKTLLNAAYDIWQEYEPESFPGSDNVDYYALFAFDATWILIQSLQQLCSTMTNKSSACLSFINTSFCFDRRFLNSTLFFDIINNSSLLGVSGSIQFTPNGTDRINGTYYVAKNIQRTSNSLSYVPVLVYSYPGNWTSYMGVIVWPDNSLVSPAGYATVSGVTLQIAVKEAVPYTMVRQITDKFGKNTTKLIGYVPDLIQLLQDKMGFIPNIIIASNLTYNELVDAVANGVYDMVVADTTITASRREKVAFSSSIFDNSLRIIIRKRPFSAIDLLSYLRPFSFKLWMTLLIASIYAGFLICLLERQENEALRDKSMISLIGLSMWYSIGTIVAFGVDFDATTAAGRLLTIGLVILSLISAAAYTANLASGLTISKSRYIISGSDDIKNGKISFGRIGIRTDSAIEEYYLRVISHGIRNFYPLKSGREIYENLLNNKIDASIMDAGPLEYSTNKIYCNLTVVGSDFDISAFGIVFHKNWLYQHDFDVNVLSLRESNAFDDLKVKWFQTNYCSASSETSTAMTIASMAGLFVTFGVISILAVLLFAWKNRFIIRDYVLILKRSKDLLCKRNTSMEKKSNNVSCNRLSISRSSSLPTLYLRAHKQNLTSKEI